MSLILGGAKLTMLVVSGVVEHDRIGAMCADLLSLCRAAALALERGDI